MLNTLIFNFPFYRRGAHSNDEAAMSVTKDIACAQAKDDDDDDGDDNDDDDKWRREGKAENPSSSSSPSSSFPFPHIFLGSPARNIFLVTAFLFRLSPIR